jgi:hypothetical protein
MKQFLLLFSLHCFNFIYPAQAMLEPLSAVVAAFWPGAHHLFACMLMQMRMQTLFKAACIAFNCFLVQFGIADIGTWLLMYRLYCCSLLAAPLTVDHSLVHAALLHEGILPQAHAAASALLRHKKLGTNMHCCLHSCRARCKAAAAAETGQQQEG